MDITVRELSAENLRDLPLREYPYTVWGRLRLRLEDGVWSYTEERIDRPYSKLFPLEADDRAEYLEAPDKTAFLAYADGIRVGSIRLERAWNRYGFIWDLGVLPEFRGMGVGAALMARAEDWASAQGLPGLALEAQDVNLPATRFYEKMGFEIGGVNTRLYRNFPPVAGETAVFWYKDLDPRPEAAP